MEFEKFELSPAADFHVHLRDDDLMRAVTPTIKKGGVDTVSLSLSLSLFLSFDSCSH